MIQIISQKTLQRLPLSREGRRFYTHLLTHAPYGDRMLCLRYVNRGMLDEGHATLISSEQGWVLQAMVPPGFFEKGRITFSAQNTWERHQFYGQLYETLLNLGDERGINRLRLNIIEDLVEELQEAHWPLRIDQETQEVWLSLSSRSYVDQARSRLKAACTEIARS